MNASFFTDLDPDVYKTITFFFLLLLVMRFILVVLKKLLDQKLKDKIIEKGMSEEITATLLQSEESNELSNSIKWFLLLLSAGIGLFITSKSLPLGLHSIGIIAISISIGFLVYSFYLKNFDQ